MATQFFATDPLVNPAAALGEFCGLGEAGPLDLAWSVICLGDDRWKWQVVTPAGDVVHSSESRTQSAALRLAQMVARKIAAFHGFEADADTGLH